MMMSDDEASGKRCCMFPFYKCQTWILMIRVELHLVVTTLLLRISSLDRVQYHSQGSIVPRPSVRGVPSRCQRRKRTWHTNRRVWQNWGTSSVSWMCRSCHLISQRVPKQLEMFCCVWARWCMSGMDEISWCKRKSESLSLRVWTPTKHYVYRFIPILNC